MGKRAISVNEFCLGEKLFWLLILVFTLLSDGKISEQKVLAVNKKLKMLNKPAVKSIKSEDGDIIDCVDIYKQPAFDHPALKNHTIQLRPRFNPETMETTTTKEEHSAITIISQLWQKSGSCPQGTVPIRRIKKQDLLRTTSPEGYGRKSTNVAPTRAINITETNFLETNNSKAYLITQGYNYLGAKADLNVWNPYVDAEDEYSSSQIWLVNGPSDRYETIESGWVVNPKVYGDKLTRLFGYWTSDGSMKTGCFDLTCPGFVQTSKEIALGGSIEPISSRHGPQYQISIYVFQDPETGNWWFQFGDDIRIGYWPGSIFGALAHSAIITMWGGEVYSPRIDQVPHTTTQMGSGANAETKFGFASYISGIRIMDYSLTLKFPDGIWQLADEVYCYNVYFHREGYFAEPYFYFGGPGRNPPGCPLTIPFRNTICIDDTSFNLIISISVLSQLIICILQLTNY